jgi:hypothetical protein
LVSLEQVWARCQQKPFYRTFSLQVAGNNVHEGSLTEKLTRRVAAWRSWSAMSS